jgi:hypothetical protein
LTDFLLLAVVGVEKLTQTGFTNWLSVLISMASLIAQSDVSVQTKELCFRKGSHLTSDTQSSSKNVPKTFHTW